MTQSVSPYSGSELTVHPRELTPSRPSAPSRATVARGYDSFPEDLRIGLASHPQHGLSWDGFGGNRARAVFQRDVGDDNRGVPSGGDVDVDRTATFDG